MGGAFAASVKPFVQHGRASSKYFGERHSWPSHLQADLAAACRRDTNLGTGGEQQPQFAVSVSLLTVLGHVPREFLRCFGPSPVLVLFVFCTICSKFVY